MRLLLAGTLLAFVLFSPQVFAQLVKVRLKDVTTLTLRRGEYTAGRRSKPVPQLRCVGGSAQGQFTPEVVQCYNRGFDGQDVQWECRASMPREYQFGKISVTCEGYDYPEDPFILAQSCGLEYELNVGPLGSASYAKKSNQNQYYDDDQYHINWSGIVLFGIVCFVIYLLYLTLNGPRPGNEGDRFRGGDGGFGPGYPPGGGNPPPPGFRPPPPSYDDATKGSSSTGARGGGGGPGFWSGLGLGALGGYVFGNRGDNAYGTGGGAYRRGGYRRGPTQFERDTGFYDHPSPSAPYQSHRSDSPGPSTSASTHTSTSFGGTTRR